MTDTVRSVAPRPALAPISFTATSMVTARPDEHVVFDESRLQRAMRAEPKPGSPETSAVVDAADAIERELDRIDEGLAAVGDRQRILTDQLRQMRERAIPAVRAIAEEARSFARTADQARTPTERQAALHQAEGRAHAAIVLAQVQRFQAAYLSMANAADDGGYPSSRTVEILGSVDRALAPLVDAALTFDPDRIQRTVEAHRETLVDLHDGLSRWSRALDEGAELSRKGIAAADAALIVLSIYDAGRTLASLGRTGPPAIHGLAANGTAIASSSIATEELAEAVRKLVELGAVDAAVVSKTPAFGGPPPLPEPILRRPTPSGEIVPTRGPFAGKVVRYGDPRDKHTQVADKTLDQMLEALKRPNKAKGDLKTFADKVKRGNDEQARKYGSQLSKEATDRYEELVRDAVENGLYKDGKFHHEADEIIGVDVVTGRPTRSYRVDLSATGHGAHIVPHIPGSK